jgi:Flagellar hook-length control protein FliK
MSTVSRIHSGEGGNKAINQSTSPQGADPNNATGNDPFAALLVACQGNVSQTSTGFDKATAKGSASTESNAVSTVAHKALMGTQMLRELAARGKAAVPAGEAMSGPGDFSLDLASLNPASSNSAYPASISQASSSLKQLASNRRPASADGRLSPPALSGAVTDSGLAPDSRTFGARDAEVKQQPGGFDAKSGSRSALLSQSTSGLLTGDLLTSGAGHTDITMHKFPEGLAAAGLAVGVHVNPHASGISGTHADSASATPSTTVTFGDLQSLLGVTKAAASVSSTGQHSVQVQVHPAGLGTILVSVEQTANGLSVSLLANQMQVSQWLGDNAEALQSQLMQNGVSVSQVAVGFGDTGLHQQDAGSSDRRQRGQDSSVRIGRTRAAATSDLQGTEPSVGQTRLGWQGSNVGGWG